MWLSSEDIKTFTGIGKVLWLDPVSSRRSTIETLSVISLIRKTPEHSLERAAQALLDRARRESKLAGSAVHLEALNQVFFRLTHEERLILVALHQGRWSYDRLSRILNQPRAQVEELAWKARVKLAKEGSYPHGPHPRGDKCPEYDAQRPWAQRFLDGEISLSRERLHLQQHLVECSACSSFLIKCRELYFNVEKEVVALSNDPERVASLEELIKKNPKPGVFRERSFWETLVTFFIKNRDVQWVSLILLGMIFLWIAKSFRS